MGTPRSLASSLRRWPARCRTAWTCSSEDNILWECTCETLKSGHICRWQVIGGVDTVASRKFRKQHHNVVRYALLR